MAKVIAPLHSSEARGRVGGIIYNTWRGAATVKAKHAPAQPGSASQLAQRANASMLSRYWGSILSAVERATWSAYSSTHVDTDWTGSTKRLTGLNWFLRCTSRLLLATQPIVPTAPIVAAPTNLTGVTAVGGAGLITMDWTTPVSADFSIFFYKSGPRSPGRIPTRAKAKLVGVALGTALSFVMEDATPGVHDVWVCAMDVDNGLVSSEVLVSATVTAAI